MVKVGISVCALPKVVGAHYAIATCRKLEREIDDIVGLGYYTLNLFEVSMVVGA